MGVYICSTVWNLGTQWGPMSRVSLSTREFFSLHLGKQVGTSPLHLHFAQFQKTTLTETSLFLMFGFRGTFAVFASLHLNKTLLKMDNLNIHLVHTYFLY